MLAMWMKLKHPVYGLDYRALVVGQCVFRLYNHVQLVTFLYTISGAGLAQWREHSPFTNADGLGSNSGFDAICGLSFYSDRVGFSPGGAVFPFPRKPIFVLICSDFS